MNVTPIIFFDMIASILILSLGFIAVAIYLAKIMKALHDKSDTRNDTLDNARIKAIKIIDDANNQAIDIISKVTLSADTASDNFKEDLSQASATQIKKFEKATSDFTTLYSKVLQDLKTKNIEIFQTISKDIETNAMKETESFKESIRKLTCSSQDEVKKKIDSDYQTARKEILSYRKEELEKVDSEIYAFLEKMSKLVLGKALSLSEHEDLIEKSLDKAKKEGVFSEK